jgi:GxxExxY protein
MRREDAEGAKFPRREEREGKMGDSSVEFRARYDSGVPADVEQLAYEVIGAAIEVHRLLGPGLLESAYRKALCHELELRNIPFETEAPFDIIYKNVQVGQGRVDLLVAGRLVVELKAVDSLCDAHTCQAVSYLSAIRLPLALLINFNVKFLKDGMKHVIKSR